MQYNLKLETHISTLVTDITQTIDLIREDVETANFNKLNLQELIYYINNITNKYKTDGERLRAIISYYKITFTEQFFTPILNNANFVDSKETNIYFKIQLNRRLLIFIII